MTPDEAMNFVRLVTSAYPSRELNDPEMYAVQAARVFADYSVETAKLAAERVVRTCKFFPSVAELSTALADAVRDMPVDPAKVLKARAFKVRCNIPVALVDAEYVAMIDQGMVTLEQARAHGYSLAKATVLPHGVERPPLRLVHATARRVDDGDAA